MLWGDTEYCLRLQATSFHGFKHTFSRKFRKSDYYGCVLVMLTPAVANMCLCECVSASVRMCLLFPCAHVCVWAVSVARSNICHCNRVMRLLSSLCMQVQVSLGFNVLASDTYIMEVMISDAYPQLDPEDAMLALLRYQLDYQSPGDKWVCVSVRDVLQYFAGAQRFLSLTLEVLRCNTRLF